MAFDVETLNVDGRVTALAVAGAHTLVIDRPGGIEYRVEIEGDAERERLEALVARVDAIAEIPSSLRRGTAVTLVGARVVGHPGAGRPG